MLLKTSSTDKPLSTPNSTYLSVWPLYRALFAEIQSSSGGNTGLFLQECRAVASMYVRCCQSPNFHLCWTRHAFPFSYCRGLFLRKCRLLLAEIRGCFCGCTWNVINCQASIHAEVELFIRLATTVYGSRCRVLQCVSVCYNVLQWLIWPLQGVFWSVLQSVAVCCSLLQSVAVCCILLQSVAVCIDVLQLLIQSANTEGLVFSVMQCIAVCCSVLLYVAVICKVSQCVAVCSSCWSVWLLDRAHSAEMKRSLDGNIGLF